MKLWLGIVHKLTLVFVLLVAFALGGVSLLVFNSGRSQLRNSTVSKLLSAAIEKQSALDDWINEKKMDITMLAADPALVNHLERHLSAGDTGELLTEHAAELEHLERWVGKGKDFISLMVLSPSSGEGIMTTDPREMGKFKEDQPYFIYGSQAPYVQEFFYSLEQGGVAMVAAAPIQAPDGQLVGVLAGYLNLDKINAIVQRRTGVDQSDDALLVNTSNLFVTQPRLFTDLAVLQRGVHTEAVNRCLEHNSGVAYAPDYRSVPAIVVYRWLSERELCLIVKMDQAEAFAPIRAFGNSVLLVALLTLLIASMLAIAVARSITRPVFQLVSGAQEIGKGNLAYRIRATGRDEIGQLAWAFNQMVENLQTITASRDELNQEIAERTRAEAAALSNRSRELERSNKELEQFAYVASHDLQEPLRMITSYLQLIRQRYAGKLDADADEFIDFAVDGSNRLQRLINDLLTYSRVGTRGKPFEPTDCNVVLGQVRANPSPIIEETQALVTNDELPTLMADEDQLVQLFQNLIANAIKFHGDETPHVHVSASSLPSREGSGVEDEVQFSIRDNGIGMDMKYAERIFVIFQRLHDRQTYPGTGIGLAVAKRIVERHGGRIWVESAPGKGSTFYFTISEDSGQ